MCGVKRGREFQGFRGNFRVFVCDDVVDKAKILFAVDGHDRLRSCCDNGFRKMLNLDLTI